MKKKMKIKTKNGTGVGMPLTDLQIQSRWLKMFVILGWLSLITAWWVIWKILSTGAVNTIIANMC